jgi:hypothetical protein
MASSPNAMARAGFVTVTAKVSIAMGIVATLYAAVQVIAAWLLLGQVDTETVLGFLASRSTPAPALWVLTHLTAIAVGFLGVCIAFLAVAVGLLRRRAWGWWGFVFFMVAGAAANFAGIAVIDAAFSWIQSLPSQPGTEEMRNELAGLRLLALAMLWATALAFAVLHGLVVWQLCRRDVRAEFGMIRTPR